jgi:tetratricopeptide (TPR) repeat protein
MDRLLAVCLACLAYQWPSHGEETVADLLARGHKEVSEGKAATSVFREAIGRDAALPKHWALLQKDDVGFAQICNEMALAYQLEGKLKEALEIVEAGVSAKPSDISLQLQLGDIQWQSRNYGLGQKAFEKALEINPKSAAAWHGKARCLQNTAETEEAEKAFEKAVELEPGNVRYLHDLGRLVYHTGDMGRALKIFRQAASLSPEDTMVNCEIGWIHYKQGHYADALSVFLKQTRKPNADPSCWFGLGTVMVRLERLEEAVRPLKTACEKDPAAPGYWRDLGSLLYRLERHEEATEAFRNALALAMDNPVVWHLLGTCLEKTAKYEESLAAYRTASSLDPMGDAWGDQMHILILLKQYEEAVATGKKALAQGTFDPKKNKLGLTNPRYVHRMMAEAYNKLQRYEDALKACDDAERVSREGGSGVYHLCYIQRGDALAGLGQVSKARDAYKKASRGPEPEAAEQRLRALEGVPETAKPKAD